MEQLLKELIPTAYEQDPMHSKIMEALQKEVGGRQLSPSLARSKTRLSAFSRVGEDL